MVFVFVWNHARKGERWDDCCCAFLTFLACSQSTFVLPEKAIIAGFRKSTTGFDVNFPFTLKSGPVEPSSGLDAWSAMQKVITPDLVQYFCTQASAIKAEKNWKDNVSAVEFWRYFYGVIAMGLVHYPKERHAFCGTSASCHGIFGNIAMKNHFTEESWQHAKQLWSAPREELTRRFNKISESLMIPTRYLSVITQAFY